MNLLKNIHVWGFCGLILQLLVYVLPRILLRAENYYHIFLGLGALLAFVALLVGHKKTRAEREIKTPQLESSPAAQQAVKVLSALYAVIAGLSLTTAVKEFSSLKDIFVGLENTIVFFATALPFYHGVTMFLIMNYYLKGFEGKTKEPLADFLLLFSGAIALYGMAINIDDLPDFFISFLILLLVDCVWIAYILKRKWRYQVPIEWLWLDLYMFSFLPLLLLSSKPSGGTLVIVAIVRTLTDYRVAGKYYLPP
jgi:hypothetical protein